MHTALLPILYTAPALLSATSSSSLFCVSDAMVNECLSLTTTTCAGPRGRVRQAAAAKTPRSSTSRPLMASRGVCNCVGHQASTLPEFLTIFILLGCHYPCEEGRGKQASTVSSERGGEEDQREAGRTVAACPKLPRAEHTTVMMQQAD